MRGFAVTQNIRERPPADADIIKKKLSTSKITILKEGDVKLQQMGKRSRKFLTLYKDLHPRNDIVCMCQKRMRKRMYQH